MDFASLMKAEITKSSKVKSSSTSAPTKTASAPTTEPTPAQSRHSRRAEVEAARQAAYIREQEEAAAAKREKELKRRRDEDDEREKAAARETKKRRLAEESRARREEEAAREEAARRKRLGLPPLSEKKPIESRTDGDGALAEVTADTPEDELRTKLRALKEPAILFAETHAARLRRYRALTAVKEVLSDTPIPTRLALLPEAECQVPTKPGPAALKEERAYLYRQLASYFTIVLVEWERALAERSSEVKESYPGRQAGQAFESSRQNMRPLFRAFEKGEMDDKVLEGVVEIVNKAQRRRYVDASDAYLTLSIGKAAWPIGVTMVGIHERSAREKLHEQDQKAHIMSDEVTRKYLQAIKQCLSFAQTRWPPDDHLQLMG